MEKITGTGSMKRYDVIVAGAGPGGCVAAKDLAAMGYSVLLVDRSAPEGLGHDWWDTLESDIFEKVGIDFPEAPELLPGFNFEVISPVGETGLKVSMPPSYINVDRKLLAKRILAEAVEAGADTMFETGVAGPLLDDERVRGVKTVRRGGKEEIFYSEICIDATGYAAAIRKMMPRGYGFSRYIRPRDTVVTHREIREDRSGGGRSVLIIGEELGAKWVSRDTPGLVDVFACKIDGTPGPGPRELVMDLVRREGGMGGKPLRGGYMQRIPVRRGFDSFVAPGLMLVGDSACMANPLNGSGVSSAMEAARIAAKTCDAAFEAGRFGVAALWPYNREYKTTRDVRFAKLHMLQKLVYGEEGENFHLFLTSGMMAPEEFWSVEHQMRADKITGRLPAIMEMAKKPDFLARTARTFQLAMLLESHYRSFPVRYHPERFKRWRMRTRALFNMVPGGDR